MDQAKAARAALAWQRDSRSAALLFEQAVAPPALRAPLVARRSCGCAPAI
ncbi:hypothetical protein [Streptosporangium fragile]